MLTLDPNTANTNIFLSEDNRKARAVTESLPYPHHSDRFYSFFAVMCANALTGRCYWEVEREGWVSISVAYRGMNRKGEGNESRFGRNDKSWALFASDQAFSAWHNDNSKSVLTTASFLPKRIAVYLDWDAGTLSFYGVSSDILIHLHTFQTTFTEPLYPGFGFRYGCAVYLETGANYTFKS